MPEYKDKEKLRLLKEKRGEVDSFTEYLILEGYEDEIVEEGLKYFVKVWEKVLQYYKKCLEKESCNLGLVTGEFEHDVWIRTELYHMLYRAPGKMKRKLQERVERADTIFRKATIKRNKPVYDHIENPDITEHWWLFRIPRDGFL